MGPNGKAEGFIEGEWLGLTGLAKAKGLMQSTEVAYFTE